jgi:hypothetical protein
LGVLLGSAPAAAKPVRQDRDFHLLNYRLPETAVGGTLSLTLEECGSSLTVSGEFALKAEAGAAGPVFTLTPRDLEGFRTKRTLNIALHDSGTIATINSSNADRTGAILGNVVKFAASVAGAFFGVGVPKASLAGGQTICSKAVEAALHRVRQIDDLIVTLRGQSLPQDPSDYSKNVRMIDRLIVERQGLRSGLLHVDLEAPFDLAAAAPAGADSVGGTVQVDLKPIAKAWLKGTVPAGQAISVEWKAALPPGLSGVPAQAPAQTCQDELAQAGRARMICLVDPARVRFSATAKATGLQWIGGSPQLEAKKTFPVAQWGTLQRLLLNAKLGSAREVSLTLDKFGRVSDMKWNSEARGENLTGSAATLAGQIQGIASANSDLAQQKAEIEELTTQQSLNRLRACRDILSRGGSKCPADAEVEATPE